MDRKALHKAMLYQLGPPTKNRDRRDPEGSGIAVQFNPTTLKLQYTNENTGGATTKAPNRANPTQGNAVLTLELEYDTCEEFSGTGEHVDVRARTADVRAFVRPPTENGKQAKAPPAVRFAWGGFEFDGNVTSLTEDLDYFDADGHALRAKLSLTIKEQDLRLAVGPAARTAATAVTPGKPDRPGGPGSAPTTRPESVVPAQNGESVQQALTRIGADPAQWRTAMAGLDSPANLTAGTPLQIGAEASVSGGVGLASGFGAAATVSAGAAVSGSVGVSAEASAGFALSAGGGITESATAVALLRADAAAVQARARFAAPTVRAEASARADISVRATIDPRRVTYGIGVPLKARATIR